MLWETLGDHGMVGQASSARVPSSTPMTPITSEFPGFLQRAYKKRRRFAAALLPRLFGNNVPGHTTRAPPVGFELATNGIQFYAIANRDKTSLTS